jgi:hypothetical protein
MTGRLSSVVFDCSDPHRLAHFYSELLGLPVTRVERLPSTEPGSRVYADPAGHPFCLEWG